MMDRVLRPPAYVALAYHFPVLEHNHGIQRHLALSGFVHIGIECFFHSRDIFPFQIRAFAGGAQSTGQSNC